MMRVIAKAVLAVAALSLPCAAIAGDDDARVVKRSYKFEWKAPFAEMSPQGMAIIRDAMKAERVPANAEEVRRARQRVLELISEEKLDISAIRKAQAAERALAIKEHAVAQEKILRAFQQLTPADRRAFAEGMRQREERMEQHLQRARERMQRIEQQMQRDMERVKKETGSLWIVVPPAAPVAVPVQPSRPDDGRG